MIACAAAGRAAGARGGPARSAATSTAAGSASTWAPPTCKVVGGGRRRGDLQRGDRLGAGRADRPGLPLPQIRAALKLAASKMPRARRHRRQLGRRLSSTTGPWWRRCSAASRPSRFGEIREHVPALPRRVRRAARGRQRRRRDGAGGRDVARGQRRARHRAGLERGRGLRRPRGQHHRAG
ncbi:MAG: hypothetical protein MZV63_24015 [Marinilabiliales bacterium]|nr:hypothetical protein [Marinilabiliales bacterium]